MIRRPNVRARVYQPNLQARHSRNRKYYPRSHPIYVLPCRWCHRPRHRFWGLAYPYLCEPCDRFLREFEWSATIIVGEGGDRISRILAGYRSDDDD